MTPEEELEDLKNRVEEAIGILILSQKSGTVSIWEAILVLRRKKNE
jgi:hypothetical protein